MTRPSQTTGPRNDRFAAAAGELIDEVQQTIRPDPLDRPAEREERPRWVVPSVLGVVFAGVVAWNVWLIQAGAAPLPAAEIQRTEGALVFVATQAVENFREETGRLPATLAEAGIEAPGLTYTAQRDGFDIASVHPAAPVQFSAGQSLDDFLLRVGLSPPEPISGDSR